MFFLTGKSCIFCIFFRSTSVSHTFLYLIFILLLACDTEKATSCVISGHLQSQETKLSLLGDYKMGQKSSCVFPLFSGSLSLNTVLSEAFPTFPFSCMKTGVGLSCYIQKKNLCCRSVSIENYPSPDTLQKQHLIFLQVVVAEPQ